jgi:peptidoglycan/xylan/chitin deacetylase (PgdA/CDA1 family)
LAVLAATGLVAAVPGGRRQAVPIPGPGAPRQPPHASPRAVGCVSHGTAAVRRGPSRRHIVALTFDDGPWSDTPAVVATLERFHVRATFFLIGRQVPGHGGLLRRELADGDTLGNHSFTHPDLARIGGTAGQLRRTDAAIERASGGYRPCVFRPPYGSVNAAVRHAAQQFGLSTILWDVDPRDWSRPGTAAIVRRVLSAVHNGAIVIMHDGGGPRGQTLGALPTIIRGLRRRHFGFATVPELLGYRMIKAPRTAAGAPARQARL